MMIVGEIVHITSSWIRIVYRDRTTLRSDKKVIFKYMEDFSMWQVFFFILCYYSEQYGTIWYLIKATDKLTKLECAHLVRESYLAK